MRIKTTIIVLVTLILSLANHAFATPEEDVITTYRAFVTAIRNGDAVEAMKFVEPSTEVNQPLLDAIVKETIAADAVQMEMLKQFSPRTAEEGWEAICIVPWDDLLQKLRCQITESGTAGVFVFDDETSGEGLIATMIQRDGKWVLASTNLLEQFGMTPEDLEEKQISRATAVEKSETKQSIYKLLLKQLWGKEFATAIDCQKSLKEDQKRNGVD